MQNSSAASVEAEMRRLIAQGRYKEAAALIPRETRRTKGKKEQNLSKPKPILAAVIERGPPKGVSAHPFL